MVIKKGQYPPNYEAIIKHLNPNKNTIYTYGETVYIPSGADLTVDLIAHEQTHIDQQSSKDPQKWWEIYLKDPKFRLEQELEAYRNQYKTLFGNYNRKD